MSTCLGRVVSTAVSGKDELSFERNAAYGYTAPEPVVLSAEQERIRELERKLDLLLSAQLGGTAEVLPVSEKVSEVLEKTPAEKAAETRAANKAAKEAAAGEAGE